MKWHCWILTRLEVERLTQCGVHLARWLRILQPVVTRELFHASSKCCSPKFREYVLFINYVASENKLCLVCGSWLFWLELLCVGAREFGRETVKFSVPMLFSWGICFYENFQLRYMLFFLQLLRFMTNWFIMTDIQWANWGFTWPNSEKPRGED